MHRDEVIEEILAPMTAAWPRHPVDDAQIEIWCQELWDVRNDDGIAAARALIGELMFFPSIAEFRKRAKDFANDRRRKEGRKALPEAPFDPQRQLHHVGKVREVLDKIPKHEPRPEPEEPLHRIPPPRMCGVRLVVDGEVYECFLLEGHDPADVHIDTQKHRKWADEPVPEPEPVEAGAAAGPPPD